MGSVPNVTFCSIEGRPQKFNIKRKAMPSPIRWTRGIAFLMRVLNYLVEIDTVQLTSTFRYLHHNNFPLFEQEFFV